MRGDSGGLFDGLGLHWRRGLPGNWCGRGRAAEKGRSHGEQVSQGSEEWDEGHGQRHAEQLVRRQNDEADPEHQGSSGMHTHGAPSA